MSDRIGTIEFDANRRRYRVQYDPDALAPSAAVVEVLQTIFDDERADEPLYDVVDPDALDRLLEPHPRRDRNGHRSVSFPVHGAVVTVTSDGRLTIQSNADAECGSNSGP
ncbi:HalOD1 output domain-containing protein [Natronolimnohabitans innermongolicus]|nr:HalOD1 output domain-containing protein [Natronolimnohabitans innermongolicus]